MKLLVSSCETGIDVDIADTLIKRLVGLLGKPKNWQGALLITHCNSVHMVFMRFEIDAVFLDSENRVVRVIENLRPWRISPIVRESASVLELPSGAVSRLGISIGVQLGFKLD